MNHQPSTIQMTHIDLIIGPARSGKSTLVLREYADRVLADGPESVALILPTRRRIEKVKHRLLTELGLRGLFDAHLYTFPDLADRLLIENAQTIRQVSPPTQLLLVREIVNHLADENQLRHFDAVKHYPGFIRALLDFIGELKRGAVEPDDFLRILDSAEFSDNRTRELATIYYQYQERLNAWNLFDAEGRFWWARNLLAQGKVQPLENVRTLLVDGFSDWTPTQWDVLRHLVDRCELALFTLTLENPENSQRPELFVPTQKVRHRFEETFPHATVQYVAPRALDNSTLSHLFSSLFSPVSEAPPAASHGEPPAPPSVQLLRAPGRGREVEAIAREVKKLLLQGVAPENIGVVFRNLNEYGERVRRAFEQFGLPVHVSNGCSLNQQPLMLTIYTMLNLPLRDYRRTDVLQFFNSNYVSLASFLEEDLTIDELDTATREATITTGKERWVEKLQALKHKARKAAKNKSLDLTDDVDENRRKRDGQLAEIAEKSIRFFTRLVSAFEVLPDSATFAEYIDCVLRLCRQFILPDLAKCDAAVSRGDLSLAIHSRDLQTYQKFSETMRELQSVTVQYPELNSTTTLQAFITDLHTLLSDVRLPLRRATEDRILVLDVFEARELSFDYLFVGGLVEKEFPRMVRESPFFSDGERKRLGALGINLEQRLSQQRDEAFLFYLIVTRAQQRLYLSHSSADEKGEKILASCYVDEVQRQLPEGALSITHERLSEVTPTLERVSHLQELTERVLQQLWTSGDRLQETPDEVIHAYNLLAMRYQGEGSPDLLQFLRAVDVESRRNGRNPHDLFDGMLRDEPRILEDLQSLFPPTRRYSASQLGIYGSCPFRFYATRVLKVEPAEEPSEFVQPIDRGEIYHAVARLFFARLKEVTGDTRVAEAGPDRAAQVMTEAVETLFDQHADNALTPRASFWNIEKRVCHEIMQRFLEKEITLSKSKHEPTQFEFAYGMREDDPPLRVKSDDGEVLIQGRIDRIDLVGEEGFAVYDYKTGHAPDKQDMLAGADLQLPIYAMAAQEFLFPRGERRCSEWAYYKLQRQIELSGVRMLKEKPIDDLLDQTKKFIVQHVDHIRKGYFQVEPRGSVCSSCKLKPLCRIERWRIREKSAAREREQRVG